MDNTEAQKMAYQVGGVMSRHRPFKEVNKRRRENIKVFHIDFHLLVDL
jgi:hypothetical protein